MQSSRPSPLNQRDQYKIDIVANLSILGLEGDREEGLLRRDLLDERE